MARPKRNKPFDPTKVHDRRATEFNRGIAIHVTPVEISDPYDAEGGTIIVMRQTRDDPLGKLHSHRQITDDQYQGGRAFQHDFETIEHGPQAVDPSKPYVDCSLPPERISETHSKALVRLNRAHRALGLDGTAIVHNVLVARLTMKQIAAGRGFAGERWEKYFGMRFSECLGTLATVYGFATAGVYPALV